MHHHSNFRVDRSNRSRDMALFRFCETAAVRHLVFFLKFEVLRLPAGPVLRANVRRHDKFRAECRSVKPFWRYGRC